MRNISNAFCCCCSPRFYHKTHRFIVMRRVFLIGSILYFLRSITMYVTVLPVSNTTYYCSPKSNHTSAVEIAKRVVQLMSGFGLSINGKHTYCGDFIYSGHTVSLVLGYLVISECNYFRSIYINIFSFTQHKMGLQLVEFDLFVNSHWEKCLNLLKFSFSIYNHTHKNIDIPRRISVLQWVSFLIASVGVFLVLLAHGHYTIDIIVAYYITTRLFWTYHTLTNNAFLIKVWSTIYLPPPHLIAFKSIFVTNSIEFLPTALRSKQLFGARMVVQLFAILWKECTRTSAEWIWMAVTMAATLSTKVSNPGELTLT